MNPPSSSISNDNGTYNMRRELEDMGLSPSEIDELLGGELMNDVDMGEGDTEVEEQVVIDESLPIEDGDDEFEYEYDDQYEFEEGEDDRNEIGEEDDQDEVLLFEEQDGNNNDRVDDASGIKKEEVEEQEEEDKWWKDPFARFSDEGEQDEQATAQKVESIEEEFQDNNDSQVQMPPKQLIGEIDEEAELLQLNGALEDEYEYEDETYDEMEAENENAPDPSARTTSPLTQTKTDPRNDAALVSISKPSSSLATLPVNQSNLIKRAKEIATPVPAIFIPKLIHSFLVSPLPVQLLITATTGNFAIRYWHNRRKNILKKRNLSSDMNSIQEIDEDIDLDLDDEEEDEYIPPAFGRPPPISTSSKAKKKAQERLNTPPTAAPKTPSSNNMIVGILQRGKAVSSQMSAASSPERLGKVFAMGGKRRNYKKEVEELLIQVEELTERVQVAESSRDQSIHDNDNSFRQVRT